MKPLAEVAHLYIGCPVETADKIRGILMSVDLGKHPRYGILAFSHPEKSLHYEAEEFKPILRKLEDMSKKEGKYILNETTFRSINWSEDERLFAIEISKNIQVNLEITLFLLSNNFDLFGLIESGQALDAATL